MNFTLSFNPVHIGLIGSGVGAAILLMSIIVLHLQESKGLAGLALPVALCSVGVTLLSGGVLVLAASAVWMAWAH